MRDRSRMLAIVATALVVAAALVITLVVTLGRDTTLDVRIRDAVSGRWVWGAEMRIQGAETGRVLSIRFGAQGLPLHSPPPRPRDTRGGGRPATGRGASPVPLRRGANSLPEPIDMVGLGIPDLGRFFVFEKLDGADIVAQLRPVSVNGGAIINHPRDGPVDRLSGEHPGEGGNPRHRGLPTRARPGDASSSAGRWHGRGDPRS